MARSSCSARFPCSLAARILVEEHIAYTEAIARVTSGEYEIRGRRYVKK
jgi:phosphoribosylglycinamide formyltransferase-1